MIYVAHTIFRWSRSRSDANKRLEEKRTCCIINIDKYQPVRKFAMWPRKFACSSVAHFSRMHDEWAMRSSVAPFLFARTFHVVSMCTKWLGVISDPDDERKTPAYRNSKCRRLKLKSFFSFFFSAKRFEE